MSYAQLRDDKLLIDVDAPEPLPSVAKVICAVELSPNKFLRWAGGLITLASCVVDPSLELADLLQTIVAMFYAKIEDYSIGLAKYPSASGTGAGSGSATVTVMPPGNKSASG